MYYKARHYLTEFHTHWTELWMLLQGNAYVHRNISANIFVQISFYATLQNFATTKATEIKEDSCWVQAHIHFLWGKRQNAFQDRSITWTQVVINFGLVSDQLLVNQTNPMEDIHVCSDYCLLNQTLLVLMFNWVNNFRNKLPVP